MRRSHLDFKLKASKISKKVTSAAISPRLKVMSTKLWTAINRLSIISKSELSVKTKCDFFQVVAVTILVYRYTTWILTKYIEKNLDGKYTGMLFAVLNKFRKQYFIKQQLYNHLPPISKTIQVRQTRHAGHSWRSKVQTPKGCFSMNPNT